MTNLYSSLNELAKSVTSHQFGTGFRGTMYLSKSVFFDEAYIFGSVVKPHRFSELSDIDIGFIGLKDEDFFKTMSFISSQIGLERVSW